MRDEPHDDCGLRPQERDALAASSRAAVPPPELEERVVAALVARGQLRPEPTVAWRGTRARLGRAPRPWPAAAIAAGLAVLLAGYAVGHAVGSRQTAAAMVAMQREDAAGMAQAMRQSGEAYIAALSALAQRRSQGTPTVTADESAEARTLFHAAANQMVRVFPDDPLAADILRGFDRTGARLAAVQQGDSTVVTRRVVWF